MPFNKQVPFFHSSFEKQGQSSNLSLEVFLSKFSDLSFPFQKFFSFFKKETDIQRKMCFFFTKIRKTTYTEASFLNSLKFCSLCFCEIDWCLN